MDVLAKFILMVAGNVTALLIASYFEPNFVIAPNIRDLMSVVFILAAVNLTIRPILLLIFSPLVKITLGYFHIVVAAIILYAVDIYSPSLTINGLWPLVLGAHAVGLINTAIDYSAAIIYGASEI